MNKEIERCVNCKLKDKCPLKQEIDKKEKDKKNE